MAPLRPVRKYFYSGAAGNTCIGGIVAQMTGVEKYIAQFEPEVRDRLNVLRQLFLRLSPVRKGKHQVQYACIYRWKTSFIFCRVQKAYWFLPGVWVN